MFVMKTLITGKYSRNP